MSYRKLVFLKCLVIPAGLLVLALVVRVPALGEFVTFDESRWIDRSRWFISGLLFADQECPPVWQGRKFATQGLSCMLQVSHPGITTMWAGSLGLLIHYWQTPGPAGIDLRAFLQTLPISAPDLYLLDPAVIAPTRLPLAITGALFVPFFYGLLRQLFTQRVAVVAALLLALHPFHIALSRVLHHDVLNTTFMVLSLLALVGYWLRGWRWYWLPVSAILAGLALLSKQVGWFMPLYVAVLAGLTWYYRWQGKGNTPQPQEVLGAATTEYHPYKRGWLVMWPLLREGILWGTISGLTFVAFFPAMWVIPGQVIRVIFRASVRLVQEGHIHYSLGEVSTDPGPLFYPVGWLLRATPLEILGLLSVIVVVWRFARLRSLKEQILERPVEVSLLLFVGLLWLFVALSNKKMVRYFLPAFPVINVFAAFGLLWLLDKLSGLSFRRVRYASVPSVATPLGTPGGRRAGTGGAGLRPQGVLAASPNLSLPGSPARPGHSETTGKTAQWIRRRGVLLLSSVILLIQGWLVLDNYPYYFTYYNPLFGGAPGAAQLTTIIGWGEGLNEAGDYLNQQPEAESLQVVAERYCLTLMPFFMGQVSCGKGNASDILQADYVVYYYNVVQRELQLPEQWRYFKQHSAPEHRVTLQGLDYVLIYRNPIQHQVDREVNSLPGALTALGYNLSTDGQLTLFWQNLGFGQRQLMVGLAPSQGVYPVGVSAISGDRRWVTCTPAPAFAAEIDRPQAIIESLCPLSTANLPPGLYDLQLALRDNSTITPLKFSRLAVLLINPDRRFEHIELVESAKQAKLTGG